MRSCPAKHFLKHSKPIQVNKEFDDNAFKKYANIFYFGDTVGRPSQVCIFAVDLCIDIK